MPSLFDPIQYGSIHAANRVAMSPLTRARADKEAVPTELMIEYYSQRASAGLIISEATGISREGLGWPYAPGIWNDKQVEAWKPITAAVHAKGGKIVCQLWHMGRLCHSNVTGMQPIAPSAIAAPIKHIHTYDGKLPPETPRAATKEDIQRIIGDYRNAAKKAIAAGFDGVQIHAANGYLIDSFLRDSANKRTDEYGGSPENRVRLLREVTTAIVEEIGKEQVGVRLSPNGLIQGTVDSHPEIVMVDAAKALNDLGIAFLELREAPPVSTFSGKTDQPKLHGPIRKVFKNPLILNQDYTRAEALEAVESGVADAIAFGRPYISNPDLLDRLKKDEPWTKDDIKTWYSRGPHGYTDYPTYSAKSNI